MKNAIIATILLIVLVNLSAAQKANVMPITTASNEARELFMKGLDKFDNVELPAAAKYFDQAIAEDPDFALAYCYRAVSGGGSQVVNKNFEKARSLAGNASKGEQLLISYFDAGYRGRTVEMKKDLDKLVSMYPGDKRVMLYTAYYYYGTENYKEAIKYFKKVASIDKNFPPAYNMLGYSYSAVGNFKSAEQSFKEYIRLNPDMPNPYDSYAELLLKMGRYDESIAQYQKALDLDETFISGLYGVGNAHLFKGNSEEARTHYDKALAGSNSIDDKLTAMSYKAWSYLFDDNPDDAVRTFEERRSLAEKENQRTSAFYSAAYAGLIQCELGDPSDGLARLQDISSKLDNADLTTAERENLRVNIDSWLAYAYAANDMLDEAGATADAFAEEIEPRGNPAEKKTLEMLLGIIDYKSGNYDDAVDRLSKLEPDPLIMYHHAMALNMKGDKEGSRALLTKISNWNRNELFLAMVWTNTKSALRK